MPKAHIGSVLPVQLTVHADGVLSVRDPTQGSQDRALSETELGDWIAQKLADNPDQPVVIAADKRVRYEAVMRVMSVMQRNRVKHLGLLAVPEAQQP